MSDWYPSSYWSHWRSASMLQVHNLAAEPERFNFLTFLATAQSLNVDFLPIIQDLGEEAFGFGGTSRIQESLVDINISLAFKIYQKRGASDEEIFRTLINELAVSRQEFVHGHQNIIQLRGISWNISAADDRPWPILVYEKSHLGDLHHFATHDGKDLSMKERLRICVDIGRAIKDMYSNRKCRPNLADGIYANQKAADVVHGDIKPENVLIFKQTEGDRYSAKVIDFGYSSYSVGEEQLLTLARSEPWNAPENDGRRTQWTFSQAMKADWFCFGMLCLWLLFEPLVTERKYSQQGSDDTATETSRPAEYFLYAMKGELKSHARRLLSCETDLTRDEHAALEEFFGSSLSHDPEERETSLSMFLEKLDTKSSIAPETTAIGPRCNIPTPSFQIQKSIIDLYKTDYRVRTRIAQDLINSRHQSPAAAIQAALCYSIGFGVTRDENKAKEILDEGQLDATPIQGIIADLRRRRGEIYDSAMPSIRSAGHYPRSDSVHLYIMQQKLEEADSMIRQETDDLTAIFGRHHILTVHSNAALAEISFTRGRWEETEKVLRENIEANKILFGPNDIPTLESTLDLAVVLWGQYRLEEAKDLLRTAVDNCSALGPVHPVTIRITQFLVIILSDAHELEEAERLELHILETCIASLRADHPTVRTSTLSLSKRYKKQRRWKEAEELELRALEIAERKLGRDHFLVLEHNSRLLSLYIEQDRWAEAAKLGEILLAKTRKANSQSDHPVTVLEMAKLGLIYKAQGRREGADTLLKPVAKIFETSLKQERPNPKQYISEIAQVFKRVRQLDDDRKDMMDSTTGR